MMRPPDRAPSAEIESLRVSALLLYHSKDKTAKVLAEKPSHLK